MDTDKYRDESNGAAPHLPSPGPILSGAAWKEGVPPTPTANEPSPTSNDAKLHPEGAAVIAPDKKDDKARMARDAEEVDGSEKKPAEPKANGSPLRRWLPVGLMLVGLVALLAKIKR